MPPPLTRQKIRKKALRQLGNIFEHSGTVRTIHYSCESFYKDNERTSFRITAIATYSLNSNDSKGYSVVNTAEVLNIQPEEIEENYIAIEKQMLEDFYEMVRGSESSLWVHWNMRDTYYGFSALEHRARVLGVDPVIIDDSRKIDLAKVIRDLEGPGFMRGTRLQHLLEKNDLKPRGFLSGEEEAEAFERHAYIKLHRSTLSKVRAIWKVAEIAASGGLQTEAKWWTRHGLRPSDIGWAIGDHWLYPILAIGGGIGGVAWGIAQYF